MLVKTLKALDGSVSQLDFPSDLQVLVWVAMMTPLLHGFKKKKNQKWICKTKCNNNFMNDSYIVKLSPVESYDAKVKYIIISMPCSALVMTLDWEKCRNTNSPTLQGLPTPSTILGKSPLHGVAVIPQ